MRLILAIAVLAIGASACAAAPPNIVFILADDLGVYDLACYGRKDHRTPNLDAMAARGVRFTNAYAVGSICSPTRAGLMTGRHPAAIHLTTFLPGRRDHSSQRLLQPKVAAGLPTGELTIAGDLAAAGYAAGCFGKWHLGGAGKEPKNFGFDFTYTGKANTKPSDTEGGKGEYDLTAAAIRFMEANRTKPFFVYLAHNNPHIPYTAKADLVKSNAAAFEPTYAAVVETLDDAVGRIVKSLDQLKLSDSTWVVFTSDNGGLHVPELQHERITHNGPYRAGKGFLYEGGIRVPAIVVGPGVKSGARVAPILTTDWRPTLRSLAGIAANDSKEDSLRDGVDLTNLLRGMDSNLDRPLWWHLPHYTNQGGRPSGALREGPWKLIEHYETNGAELFHLIDDPGETTDLAAKQPERVESMRKMLEALRTTRKVQRNAINPNYEPASGTRLEGGFDPSTYDPRENNALAAAMAWRKRMDEASKP